MPASTRTSDTAQPQGELIYDWNAQERRVPIARRGISLLDETLRDGLQNPSVVDPPIAQKLEILHLLNDLGVEYADVGLPGAGARAFEDVLRIAREVRDQRLSIRLGCAGRTMVSDIRPMVEVSQKAGVPVEVMAFIGSSPIRQLAEDWSVEKIRALATDAIAFSVREGLPCTFVTEDTTRTPPTVLADLFRAAIDHGATRLCLCDTVGHATPDGVRNLIEFTRAIIAAEGVEDRVLIDWHGHNDRGLALANAIFAFEYGAHRVHGTILGIGERVGNAPLELMLLNLRLLSELGERDLSKLAQLCEKVSQATHFPIPINYPVFGADAFRTGTGVHAAAIIKAQAKGDTWLADRVYSGVPAGMIGRRQEIVIGPMSGLSNVTHWLKERGHEPDPTLCEAILRAAKSSDHNLTDAEVEAIVKAPR